MHGIQWFLDDLGAQFNTVSGAGCGDGMARGRRHRKGNPRPAPAWRIVLQFE
jgi:hypothetical protein